MTNIRYETYVGAKGIYHVNHENEMQPIAKEFQTRENWTMLNWNQSVFPESKQIKVYGSFLFINTRPKHHHWNLTTFEKSF